MENNKAIIDILLSQIEKKDSLPPLSNNSLQLQKEITKVSLNLEKWKEELKI